MDFDLARRVEEYRTLGVTVLRGAVPPALVSDLRRVADRARILAREGQGPQAQRLQPVEAFALERGPIADYRALEPLAAAVRLIAGPRHQHGSDGLGILFEPAERAWSTGWHRDSREGGEVTYPVWNDQFLDRDLFAQANCALYDDASLWLVPGSHDRRDTDGERACPRLGRLDGLPEVEAELAVAAHIRAMPGATRVHLGPGDYALYRAVMWHAGAYLPYLRRATLHDFVETPAYRAFRSERDRRWRANRPSPAPAAAGGDTRSA